MICKSHQGSILETLGKKIMEPYVGGVIRFPNRAMHLLSTNLGSRD